MAKNLDGIKKLNPEEVKKNRKIVLNYIGEKDTDPLAGRAGLSKEPGLASRVSSVSTNRVDGLRLNKPPEWPALAKGNQASQQEKINFAEEKIRLEKIERAELIKKANAKKAKFKAEEKFKDEQAGKLREKLKLEEKLRAEERIIEENKRRQEIKRAEEIKRIKEEVKLAKAKAAVKRKAKRQKAIKLFKQKLNNKLNEIFSAVKRNFVFGALYLIVFLIIGYTVFCLLALRLKTDNSVIAKLARVLPVPAALTSQGLINYNDWRDLKNDNNTNLAKWIILRNLSRKYKMPDNLPDKVLAAAFIKDEDFNQAGLLRIKKISQLLKGADDLELASKYADEASGVIYYNHEEAAEKFGPAIFNLKTNQTSDIIFSDNGYYIAQNVGDKNSQSGLKYLFVRAKTLDQYISEKSAKIKIFILANN
ncbi:MAG: hypothetical protein HYV53_04725 [Parcubacteria group bacterium]|nr:hypothetical protein [Parcubacteria group bacterium]